MGEAAKTSDYKVRYGQWALVVGGSDGLGFAIAAEIAKRGMDLVITGRRQEKLNAAASDLENRFGVNVAALSIDAAAADAADRLISAVADKEIGFAVYNCAAEPGGVFVKSSREDQLSNIAVNCITPTLLLSALAQKMMARGRGGIVVCSSLAAMQGIYNRVIYGAAKAYEMILGEGLWSELEGSGVNACAFMIGSTYTPNFIRDQKARNTIFAESRIPENAPEGMALPQTPEEAAASLFAQIDGEWLPRLFANPVDQRRYEQLATQDRTVMIRRARESFLSGYRNIKDESLI